MMMTIAVNERGLRIGQDHHNARYSDMEIEHVLRLRDDGLSYGEICKIMEIPKSTVACICKATRRCQIAAAWKKVIKC